MKEIFWNYTIILATKFRFIKLKAIHMAQNSEIYQRFRCVIIEWSQSECSCCHTYRSQLYICVQPSLPHLTCDSIPIQWESAPQGTHPGQRSNNITATSNYCYLPLLFLVIRVSLNVQLLLLFSCQSLLLFSCSQAFYYIQSCYVWCDQGKCKHAHIFTDTNWLPHMFRKKKYIFKPRALLNY